MIVGRVAVASAALAVLTLTGCGQKGPLTLPQAQVGADGITQASAAPHTRLARPTPTARLAGTPHRCGAAAGPLPTRHTDAAFDHAHA